MGGMVSRFNSRGTIRARLVPAGGVHGTVLNNMKSLRIFRAMREFYRNRVSVNCFNSVSVVSRETP